MATKKYGINGVIERFMTVRLGKGNLTFAFVGGMVDTSGVRPATYSTNSLYHQTVIESLPEFKNGTIKLMVTYGEVEAPTQTETAVPEVTNVQQARSYFIEKGYEMKDVATKKDILALAAQEGITFPNWSN